MEYSMSVSRKIRLSLPGILFVLYWCNSVYYSFAVRLIGTARAHIIFIALFSGLLLLSVAQKGGHNVLLPCIVYSVVALIFWITYTVHPEYKDWFNHPFYGIIPALVHPKSGMWAFFLFWLMKDDKHLISYVKFSAWILFLYLMLKYAIAVRQGYWVINQMDGSVEKSAYNLEFGYDILFPISFFGAYAYLNKKKLYYIPFAAGVFAILTKASRGALIWPIAMFFFMIPFHWKSLTAKKRLIYGLSLTVFLVIVLVCVLYLDNILSGLSSIVSKIGISSRTVDSILNGSFTDGNGREQIYEMAIDLIKTGGPFGRGAYGDRYYIGRVVEWGYSHNLLLECLVTFGYVGGSFMFLLYITGLFKLFKKCDSLEKQIIFVAFLTTSMKLVFSNSFWYSDAFWILLAMMMGWKKRKHCVQKKELSMVCSLWN